MVSNPSLREFKDAEGTEPELAADVVDLVRTFQQILERAKSRPMVPMDEETVTVGQMIEFFRRRLLMEDRPIPAETAFAAHHFAPCAHLIIFGAAGAGALAGHPAAAGKSFWRGPDQEAPDV